MQERQREREQEWAEMAHYRPLWLPKAGSGYQEEAIPWEGDEKAAVVRKRRVKPNYEVMVEEEELEQTEVEEEMEGGSREEMDEWKEDTKKKEADKRLTYDLLFDESKWWDW